MGRIRRVADGREFVLWSRTLVGRSPQSALQLDGSAVSEFHARISWDSDTWWLHPDKTTNGTFVGSDVDALREVAASNSAAIDNGQYLRFGDNAETWLVEDTESPFPEAVDEERRIRVPSDGATLLLPNADEASVAIYADETGYVLDAAASDDGPKPLPDKVLHVGGRKFEICFEAVARTRRVMRADLLEGELLYAFWNGVHRLQFAQGLDRVNLGEYTCYGAIGRLARMREEDIAAGKPPHEIGWRQRLDLATKGELRDAVRAIGRVNLNLFRCKQQLRRVGMGSIDALFETIPREGKIRLGVPVRIVPDSEID